MKNENSVSKTPTIPEIEKARPKRKIQKTRVNISLFGILVSIFDGMKERI